MPKISVIIPVWNAMDTAPRAIASVFSQSYADYEVIVVDDGSTDDTPAMLARFGERIRVIRQSNSGASKARNTGVSASSGEYLAFLDDDDEWMADKLAHSVPILDQEAECALVYTRGLKVDLNGRQIGSLDGQAQGSASPTMQQLLERPWNVVPSQFMVRREVFERCGGFHERLSGIEDRYFLLQAREHGYFHCVADPLLRKTSRPLYPTVLSREPQYDLFVELVRERYGAAAKGLIDGFSRDRAKVLKQAARILTKEGRPEDARRCLARVIHYEPVSPSAYRKYLKTFFPTRAPRTTPRTGDGKV
jgi:glycosyltransferase involved in cell wall biosynthesis